MSLFNGEETNLAVNHFSLTAEFVDNTLLDRQNSIEFFISYSASFKISKYQN